jgi:L-arabinose isomerase
MTATRTSTASADGAAVAPKPRIALLGVTQRLYDDMLPGITDRQAGYAAEVAAALADVAHVEVSEPVKDRAGADRALRELAAGDYDGLLVVMLTYGPAMHVTRTLAGAGVPICLANIQPRPEVTADWDMADLTYNQGIHGAQDTANAMVRAGHPFEVVTGDWRSDAFRDAIGLWARAAAAVTRWRSLKVAVFGYAMRTPGSRSTRGSATSSARTTPGCSSASSPSCASTATAPTAPTSARSPRTGASPGSRSPRPRA